MGLALTGGSYKNLISAQKKLVSKLQNLAEIPTENDVDVAEIGIGVSGCSKRHIKMEVAFGQQNV